MTHTIRIIGIDPGLRRTGWGIVESRGNALSFIASGTVKAQLDGELAHRLVTLHTGLTEVMRQYQPDEAAVEQTFVNKDAGATLKLGHARGIALLVPALAGLSVAEYSPNSVKKTIVGAGHAGKEQIRMMVKVLLPKAEFDTDDAADALGIAICHVHHRVSLARMMRAVG
ncbi:MULTISPECIES: crossover junction endodeoxyribonuclease RuvC [Kaistia]|jgi:crossover junction endodeoxyribonuclease RuvC|uniref:Crossover junction endodeoxyribonuclease RuvC n=1 Tax=Kaistia defluvii TaxID=410841 RepID=A0ABV2QZS7_9HYPH|nr:crossover junction endodeoxyribonuclease RuvC [Kaistia defluvii]MCX5517524.1 crossover junction endodeoxyribonuclease RuvC [Kaistia defluvii]